MGYIVRMPNVPGVLGKLCVAIGDMGGNIISLKGFEVEGTHLTEEICVNYGDANHAETSTKAISNLDGVELLHSVDRTFEMHQTGKIEIASKIPLDSEERLSMAYTPGVARICTAIAENPELITEYTIKQNTVAIVTDGTAVLGLGDIGPEAALPVMEGKALLFKKFAGLDAFPICLRTSSRENSANEIVEAVERIAPVFGGINLEDIAAPVCFEVEERLMKSLDIPVFHDDQHGTAIVVLAALRNALKIVNKKIEDVSVVISGAGAAGVAIGKILNNAGVKEIVGTDRGGIINKDSSDMSRGKLWFAQNTNPQNKAGQVGDALVDADVFVGVSGPNVIKAKEVKRMAKDPVIFALANPDPEIRPEAVKGIAAVMATGRSDYDNQINNVLAFPGIFRGTLDARAQSITEEMKLAAAKAIAGCVPEEDLCPECIIPSVFDKKVALNVAKAVEAAAKP